MISLFFSHLVSLTSNQYYNKTGCIEEKHIKNLIEDSRDQVRNITEHHYNICPDIIINEKTIEKISDKYTKQTKFDSTIICIPSLIKFVSTEILKNAVQTTIERYLEFNKLNEEQFNQINITNIEGNLFKDAVLVNIINYKDYIIIDIVDKGKGMTDIDMNHMRNFLKSSTFKPESLVAKNSSYQPMSSPMRGLGVGLYLSTLYSRLFGGTLEINKNALSHGTTVTIKIPRDLDIEENII
jgi:signal transduction histidine kinase